MTLVNPILLEAWRALVGCHEATTRHIGYLLLQAAALLIWWPWSGVRALLDSGSPPSALTAVVIALGISLALDGVRAGADRSLLPGEHSLRQWSADTPLAPGRLVRGWLGAQLLQVVYLLALSSPLVLIAFPLSAASWDALFTALWTLLPMALCFRLGAALVCQSVEHPSQGLTIALHLAVLGVYTVTPFLLPAVSHLLLAPALLMHADAPQSTAGGLPAHLVFVAVYAGLCLVLLTALYLLLVRRRGGLEEAGQQEGGFPGARG